MLIRDIYIVDRNVRIYDMDGSYIEMPPSDMLYLGEEWYRQNKERLLLMVREENKRLHRREEHGS